MLNQKNKRKVKPIDQWQALNKITSTYKYMAVCSLVVSVLLGMLLVAIPFKKPTVVLTDGENKVYLQGKHSNVELGEDDVKEVVKSYIRLRYDWAELKPMEVYKKISPLVTDGLAKKVKAKLKHVRSKEIGKKKISQFVTNRIFVQVSKKSVLAKFFVVLDIEGKPIAAPSELSFNVIQGPVTSWNPRGLYINGVIKHSEAL